MTAHCTLTPDELAVRGTRWRSLAPAFTEARNLDAGLRLVFEPAAEAELRKLAVLETECCAYAEWLVKACNECVTLDIVAKDANDVVAVQQMFGSLRTAT